MGDVDEGSREWVVRFNPWPAITLVVAVAVGIIGRSWIAFAMFGTCAVLLVVLYWRPFRLATRDGVPQIEYLRRFRWSRLLAPQITTLRFAHAAVDFRGRAFLRADLADGTTVRIPGTDGRYWTFRTPELSDDLVPRRGLHVLSSAAR